MANQKIVPYSEHSLKVEPEGVKMEWWPNGKLRMYADAWGRSTYTEEGNPLAFSPRRGGESLSPWDTAEKPADDARAAATREYMIMLQHYFSIHPRALKAEEAECVMKELEKAAELW
jgi:hypothetical protein